MVSPAAFRPMNGRRLWRKRRCPMVEGRQAYEVVVPPELAQRWAALPSEDHGRLSLRLDRAARRASSHPHPWPLGPARAHRGKHRAIVDELWLLYCLNDAQRTVSVLAFGRLGHAA